MRLRARTDNNQRAIVKDLRKLGVSVCVLSDVGRGVPDILVGYLGANFLFEIKDDEKTPSHRKLTEDQVQWHDAWNGQVDVILSATEAYEILCARSKS